MLFVRIGLMLAALAAPAIALRSWDGGYAVEIAVLRGFLGGAAVLAVAYVAELLVSTSPPPRGLPVQRIPMDSAEAAALDIDHDQ